MSLPQLIPSAWDKSWHTSTDKLQDNWSGSVLAKQVEALYSGSEKGWSSMDRNMIPGDSAPVGGHWLKLCRMGR